MNASPASVALAELDLTLSPEQRDLAGVARDLAASLWDPTSVLRGDAPAPDDVRTMWRRSAVDLGLIGLATTGHDGSLADLCAVAAEWGRVCFPVPLLSQAGVVAPELARLAPGSDAAADLLAAVLSGERIVAPWLGAPLVAERNRLTGRVDVLLDGGLATDLLVRYRSGGVTQWGVVPLSADGVRREALDGMDLTRLPVAVELAGADVRPLGAALAHDVTSTALVCLAAELVGTASWALDNAVEHVTRREQFGRPVGSFQGVKHRAARMLVAVETARSAVRAGAAAVARAPHALDTRDQALEAAVRAAAAAVGVTAGQMGLLGGIGFTWEHPAHLAYRRVRSARTLFGGPGAWCRELDERLS